MKTKLLILLLGFFLLITISGCAADTGRNGGYERPAGHSGHVH